MQTWEKIVFNCNTNIGVFANRYDLNDLFYHLRASRSIVMFCFLFAVFFFLNLNFLVKKTLVSCIEILNHKDSAEDKERGVLLLIRLA